MASLGQPDNDNDDDYDGNDDDDDSDDEDDDDDDHISPDPFQGVYQVCSLGGQLAKHLLPPGEGNMVVSEIFGSNCHWLFYTWLYLRLLAPIFIGCFIGGCICDYCCFVGVFIG